MSSSANVNNKNASSKKQSRFASSREPVLGAYDCLYKDEKSSIPQIGKFVIHRSFVVFTSTFNANATRRLKQRDFSRVDATSKIRLILYEKEKKAKNSTAAAAAPASFQLQFVDNTECFERLVKKWKLEYGKMPKEEKRSDGNGEEGEGEDGNVEEDEDEETDLKDVDLRRVAYKPLKVKNHRRNDSMGGDEDDSKESANDSYADAFIRTLENVAGKLPFGAGKKLKYATYFLRQQLRATRRMTKKSVKYTMRYVNRRSRELALARKRQAAKSSILRKVEAVEVEKEVSRHLFVRLIRAKNVLAMDDGGTSDPFTEIRFRGLQNVSKTMEKTCDPEWDQTFTFSIPNGKRVLDASDAVELYVYDRTWL